MEKLKDRQAAIKFLEKGKFIPHNVVGILDNRCSQAYTTEDYSTIWVENDYFNYVFGNENEIDAHLNTLKDGFYGFSGVLDTLAQSIYEKHLLHWYEPTDRYVLTEIVQDFSDIYEMKNIDISEAQGIDERYEYRQEGSLERIKDAILSRPTSAIYQNGEIASYVLVHEDNSIGYMYTRPEYREHGLAYWVTLDILNKMVQKGKVPFVEINQRNVKSQGLARKTNLKKDAFTPWFGIVKGTPEWFDNWDPLEGNAYIFTTLVHLKMINQVTSDIAGMNISQVGEDYVCEILEPNRQALFHLKNDASNEGYVLSVESSNNLSLYEIVCGLVAYFPDSNTPIVLPYQSELVDKIGCIPILK